MRACLAALIVSVSCPPAAAQAPDWDAPCPPGLAGPGLSLPASAASVASRRTLTVVALGSSSTFGAGASSPSRAYPALLESALREALPGVAVRVLNRGVNGQDAQEEVSRLGRDVLSERPDLVIWQIGTNAALRGDDPASLLGAAEAGAGAVIGSGADLVFMDGQRCPALSALPGRGAASEGAVETAAAAGHAGLFRRGRLMDAWAQGEPLSDFLARDGLHQSDRGYACLARALAASILKAVSER